MTRLAALLATIATVFAFQSARAFEPPPGNNVCPAVCFVGNHKPATVTCCSKYYWGRASALPQCQARNERAGCRGELEIKLLNDWLDGQLEALSGSATDTGLE